MLVAIWSCRSWFLVNHLQEDDRHFIFNHLGEVIAFWGPTYTDESKTLHPNVPLGQDPSFDRISRMGRHNIHIARQALRGVLKLKKFDVKHLFDGDV